MATPAAATSSKVHRIIALPGRRVRADEMYGYDQAWHLERALTGHDDGNLWLPRGGGAAHRVSERRSQSRPPARPHGLPARALPQPMVEGFSLPTAVGALRNPRQCAATSCGQGPPSTTARNAEAGGRCCDNSRRIAGWPRRGASSRRGTERPPRTRASTMPKAPADKAGAAARPTRRAPISNGATRSGGHPAPCPLCTTSVGSLPKMCES